MEKSLKNSVIENLLFCWCTLIRPHFSRIWRWFQGLYVRGEAQWTWPFSGDVRFLRPIKYRNWGIFLTFCKQPIANCFSSFLKLMWQVYVRFQTAHIHSRELVPYFGLSDRHHQQCITITFLCILVFCTSFVVGDGVFFIYELLCN